MISSLDSILNTTTSSQLSECSPTTAKETDANIDTPAPVSDQSPQKTTASEHVQIKSPASSHTGDQPTPDSSHQKQVKDDSIDSFDTTDYSVAQSVRSLIDSSPQKPVIHVGSPAIDSPLRQARDNTALHVPTAHSQDDNTITASSPVTHTSQSVTQSSSGWTDSSHQPVTVSDLSNQKELTNLKDESVQTSASDNTLVAPQATSSSASIDASSEPTFKAIIHCHDKLVTALSTDILSISGILLANEFIPSEVSSRMLLPNLISQE